MANFTKAAIKQSFIKLLDTKPLAKITVKDIVEDCGINRNSFYYHFSDIPALLDEIITDATSVIITAYPEITELDEFITSAFRTAVKYRRAVYHIYNSVSRDVFEDGLMKMCDYVVETYTKSAFEGQNISADDKRIAVTFIRCELFGLITDWLRGGMTEEAINDIHHVTKLCRGLSAELIKRSREYKN